MVTDTNHSTYMASLFYVRLHYYCCLNDFLQKKTSQCDILAHRPACISPKICMCYEIFTTFYIFYFEIKEGSTSTGEKYKIVNIRTVASSCSISSSIRMGIPLGENEHRAISPQGSFQKTTFTCIKNITTCSG